MAAHVHSLVLRLGACILHSHHAVYSKISRAYNHAKRSCDVHSKYTGNFGRRPWDNRITIIPIKVVHDANNTAAEFGYIVCQAIQASSNLMLSCLLLAES